MPRLRQCLATRTSSIRPREAPCELSPGQDAELQAADHGALPFLGDDEMNVRVACELLERREIGLRQRVFDPLASTPERIVRQHGDDGSDILAAGAADGDL
jgi:hypothetical protein